MTVQLQVHDIGRADDPTATTRTTHADAHAARMALNGQFGARHIRGDANGGTVGSMTGTVFQASKTWSIREL